MSSKVDRSSGLRQADRQAWLAQAMFDTALCRTEVALVQQRESYLPLESGRCDELSPVPDCLSAIRQLSISLRIAPSIWLD